MENLYLVHHGIRGQKWGVRRFQNEDGSVTPAGAKRYYGDFSRREKRREFRADRKLYGKKAAKQIRAQRESGESRTASTKGLHKISKQDRLMFGRKGAEKYAERRNRGESIESAARKEGKKATSRRLATVASVGMAVYAGKKLYPVAKMGVQAVKAGKAIMEAAKWAEIKANAVDLNPSEFREILGIGVG